MLPLSQPTFARLAQLIHGLCGLVLSSDKTYLVHHRLEPIVQQLGLRSYEELCDLLRAPGYTAVHDQVIEAITTHETSFFRDGHPFETLRLRLLPELIATARQRKQALGVRPFGRIWCAGAATGEEAYTVAMLLDELVAGLPRGDLELGDFSLLATDVSTGVLDVARAAIYRERDVQQDVPSPYQRRYFQPQPAGWQVVQPLRRLVAFRRDNLLNGAVGAGPFDLILCRNAMIYFDEATRRRVCRGFHEALYPGGVLMLGAAENLYGIAENFSSEQFGQTFYYRKGGVPQ